MPTSPLVLQEGTTDAELVDRIRAGSDEALAAAYERHAGALLRVAQDLLGSADDAEDVLHDVFLGLPRALRGYTEQGQLSAWLRRVTARVALMRLRRGRQPMPVRRTEESSATLRLEIDDVIAALPETLRTPFILREMVGYTHEEIADALGISGGAARVRYSRALQALRAALKE